MPNSHVQAISGCPKLETEGMRAGTRVHEALEAEAMDAGGTVLLEIGQEELTSREVNK